MAISYTIEGGYNSSARPAEVRDKLRNVVSEIRNNPDRIAAELLQFEPEWDVETVNEYVQSYLPINTDLTVHVYEPDDSYVGSPFQVRQCASGGGWERQLKEGLRRAFCRLVLREMHQARMEINIHVS